MPSSWPIRSGSSGTRHSILCWASPGAASWWSPCTGSHLQWGGPPCCERQGGKLAAMGHAPSGAPGAARPRFPLPFLLPPPSFPQLSAQMKQVAPPGWMATIQGILSGIWWGIASGIGGLAGGLVYEHVSPEATFRLGASVVLCGWLLYTIMDRLSSREEARDGSQRRGGGSGSVLPRLFTPLSLLLLLLMRSSWGHCGATTWRRSSGAGSSRVCSPAASSGEGRQGAMPEHPDHLAERFCTPSPRPPGSRTQSAPSQAGQLFGSRVCGPPGSRPVAAPLAQRRWRRRLRLPPKMPPLRPESHPRRLRARRGTGAATPCPRMGSDPGLLPGGARPRRDPARCIRAVPRAPLGPAVLRRTHQPPCEPEPSSRAGHGPSCPGPG